jgi:membrane protease YdiL (CAAX protease family)
MTCLVLLAGLENDAALLAGSTLAGVSVIAVLVLMGRLRRDAPSGGDSEKVWGGHSAPFLADGIEGMAGTRGRSGTGGIWSLKQLGLMVAMWYVLLYALTLVFAVVSTLLPELESMAGPASYAIGIATTLFILFVFVWRKGLRLRQIGVRPFCPQAWVLVLAGFLAVRSLWAHVKWSLVLSIGYSSGYETNRVPSDLWRSFSDTVGTGLVAPLIEELVFRGILFKGLVTHIGPKKGALLSALVYSLAHILLLPQAPYVDVNGPQLFMLFFSGLLLAGLYHDTGSIWPGVVLHGAFNLSLQ